MPDLGGVDISPIIVFILIYLIQQLIVYYLYPLAS
jgi:YggT family protein